MADPICPATFPAGREGGPGLRQPQHAPSQCALRGLGAAPARLAWHYTPQHGSWLNIAASGFAALAAQCLDRHSASEAVLRAEIAAWVRDRNALGEPVHWQFTTADARIKHLQLYPTFE